MKKSIIISTLATLLLTGFTALQANEVTGTAEAKAKVEEVAAKEGFKAKEDASKFKKEALKDEKKLDATAEVKEIEAKDQADAKTKIKAFEKEAITDKKKVVK